MITGAHDTTMYDTNEGYISLFNDKKTTNDNNKRISNWILHCHRWIFEWSKAILDTLKCIEYGFKLDGFTKIQDAMVWMRPIRWYRRWFRQETYHDWEEKCVVSLILNTWLQYTQTKMEPNAVLKYEWHWWDNNSFLNNSHFSNFLFLCLGLIDHLKNGLSWSSVHRKTTQTRIERRQVALLQTNTKMKN